MAWRKGGMSMDDRKHPIEFEEQLQPILSKERRRQLRTFLQAKILRQAADEAEAGRNFDKLTASWLDLGQLSGGAPNVTIWPRYASSQGKMYHSFNRAIWAFHDEYPVSLRAPTACRQPSREEKVLEEIEGVNGEKWRLVFRGFQVRSLEEGLVYCAAWCLRTWAMPYPGSKGAPEDRPGRALANGMAWEWMLDWRLREEKKSAAPERADVCTEAG